MISVSVPRALTVQFSARTGSRRRGTRRAPPWERCWEKRESFCQMGRKISQAATLRLGTFLPSRPFTNRTPSKTTSKTRTKRCSASRDVATAPRPDGRVETPDAVPCAPCASVALPFRISIRLIIDSIGQCGGTDLRWNIRWSRDLSGSSQQVQACELVPGLSGRRTPGVSAPEDELTPPWRRVECLGRDTDRTSAMAKRPL